MPRGVPKSPDATKAGRKAILADPVNYGGGLVERRHLARIQAKGGIAYLRRLIDEDAAREAEAADEGGDS